MNIKQFMQYKVMTWVLIMTLLVSQSFAYASEPCVMSDMTAMTDMSHDESSDMDCCSDECPCPMATGSVKTMIHEIKIPPVNLVYCFTEFVSFSVLDVFPPLSQKPPIFS
ncbi:MAG: hypothetical protein JKY14_12135 [Paraglaciecola sp.]|nr:hypothetical protein [Paraglaciecola sp.]